MRSIPMPGSSPVVDTGIANWRNSGSRGSTSRPAVGGMGCDGGSLGAEGPEPSGRPGPGVSGLGGGADGCVEPCGGPGRRAGAGWMGRGGPPGRDGVPGPGHGPGIPEDCCGWVMW
ncbi:hypothetical protein GCM10028820_06710 [Tessaracoccus terricola]